MQQETKAPASHPKIKSKATIKPALAHAVETQSTPARAKRQLQSPNPRASAPLPLSNPGRRPTPQVIVLTIHLTSPIQHLILIEPLPQPPGDLCPRQLNAHIKRMPRIPLEF